MKVIVVVAALASVAYCGYITHHDDGHHKATSFQNIHIEHFHSVPTYIKKEDHHLIEHPIPKGKSSSEVKIHHGNKHDPGYAIVTKTNDIHGHEHGQSHESTFIAGGGHEELSNSHEGLQLSEEGHGISLDGGHGISLGGGQEISLGGGQESGSQESSGGYEVQDHGHHYAQFAESSQGHEGQQQQQGEYDSLGQGNYAFGHYQLAGGDSSHLGGQPQQQIVYTLQPGLSQYGKS